MKTIPKKPLDVDVDTESNHFMNQEPACMTQYEVAKALGITRVRVQQIEREMFVKIKKVLTRYRIYKLEDIL